MPQPIISSWSVQTHAKTALKHACWAHAMTTALSAETPRDDHAYCAAQLLSAAKQMLAEAQTISAKVEAGEGSALETTRTGA